MMLRYLLLIAAFRTAGAGPGLEWDNVNLQKFANLAAKHIFTSGLSIDFIRDILSLKDPPIFSEHTESGLFFNPEALQTALGKIEKKNYNLQFIIFFRELKETFPEIITLGMAAKNEYAKYIKDKIFDPMSDHEKTKLQITDKNIIKVLVHHEIAAGLEKKAKLTEETEILQKILDELNAKKHKAEIELEEKQDELKEKHTEVEKMSTNLAQEAEEKFKIVEELEELRKNVNAKESAIGKLNEMIEERQKLAKQKQHTNEELNKNEMELKQNISELEKKMQKYEHEINQLIKQIEIEKNQLDNIKNVVATNVAEKNERDAKLNELQKEIEEMENRKIELEGILAKKEEENRENARKAEEKLSQGKAQRKNEVEYPMLERSLSLANEQELKPCDDFYKFVCAGDKFYKEQKKSDGGNRRDLVKIYTDKVLHILTNPDRQMEYSQKYPFMAKGFIYFNKCVYPRPNSRMATMGGAGMALKRLISKLRDQLKIGLNLVPANKHWLNLASPYLPLVEITEESIVTVGERKSGQNFVGTPAGQQQQDKNEHHKIKVEKIIKINFVPKLSAGNYGDSKTWKDVAAMMAVMYQQGLLLGTAKQLHEGIEKRMGKLYEMEEDIYRKMMKKIDWKMNHKKVKIAQWSMSIDKVEISWVEVIQRQFHGKKIDKNTEVLIDIEMTKMWLESVHELSKDKETFGDFLLWHQILGKVGNFNNTKEMYEKWYKVLNEEANFLDSLNSDENKATAQKDIQTCIKHMNVYFPHVIDRLLYEILNEDGQVEAFLAKNRQILKYVRKGFEHILHNETPWMDAETRVNALEKLHKMREFVGFLPNTLDDAKLNGEIYGEIKIVEGTQWMELMDQMLRNRQKRNKLERLTEMLESGYDPLEQNARYLSTNQLLINSLILMEPKFNLAFPDAYNFAAIGSIMGHELTRGFDTTGRTFYLDGVKIKDPGWWSQKSLKEFEDRQKCLKWQYKNYEKPKNSKMFENEKGIIQEGIADNGGLRAAYKGWEMYMAENEEEVKRMAQQIKGLLVPDSNNKLVPATPKQLFFIAFAYSQCSVTNCEPKEGQSECREAEEYVHSTARVRVNLPLRMFWKFHRAFDCPTESSMDPAEIRVW